MKVSVIGVLIAMGAFLLLQVVVTDDQIRGNIDNVVLALAAVATAILMWFAARAARKQRDPDAQTWSMFAVGFGLWALGDIVWAVINIGFGDDPYPSLADAAYLAFYVAFIIGLHRTRGRARRDHPSQRPLDYLIVGCSMGLLFWVLLSNFSFTAGGHKLMASALTITYVGLDLALMSLLLWQGAWSKRHGRLPFFLLSAALGLLAGLDALFGQMDIQGLALSGGIEDTLWLFTILLAGLAAVARMESPVQAEETDDAYAYASELTWTTVRTWVWVGGALVALVWSSLAHGKLGNPGMVALLALILIMAAVRQLLGVRRNFQLNMLALEEVARRRKMEEWLENERRRLEAEVAQRVAELQRAENLVHTRLRLVEFAAGHTLAELLQRTLDEVCALTGSPIGFYHFVDPDQVTLTLQAWSTRTLQEFCTATAKGAHYGIEAAGVWVDCIRQRRLVIHNDYAALPHRKGLPEGHAQVRRELVVPILRKEKIVAVLGIGNKEQDYSEKDIELVAYFADVAWEIASRKRVEEMLRHANLVIENSPVVIFRWQAIEGWPVVMVSKNVGQFGYTQEELLSGATLFASIVYPEDLDRVAGQVQEYSRGGTDTFHQEYRLVTKDGRIRWVEDSTLIERDGQGQPLYFQGVVIDITDRKSAELAFAEEHLQLVKTLDEVRTLRGIIPICANCKQIRDDKGYWNEVERYISKHTDATFTHGICPECIKKLYPEFARKKRQDKK